VVPIVPARRARRFEETLVARGRVILHRIVRVRAGVRSLVIGVPHPLPAGARTLQVRWRRVGARPTNACVLALPGHRPIPACRPAFPNA
jgi:hypothetical protein